MYTKGETVAKLLDFTKPHTNGVDPDGKDKCECCGTYYVLHWEERQELEETVTLLYEALKELTKDYDPSESWGSGINKALRAVKKAEGR